MSMSLSVCLHAYLRNSKIELHQISVHVAIVAFGRGQYTEIYYVLPVLWMTPCFPIMGAVAW